MAVTLKFQSSGAVPGDGRPVSMRGPSLSIGRGPDNDLVLPDPDRMISKTHCVIENQGGSVVVVDTSTNGTFLNYGKQALGRVATPLSDGDVLILGPYELIVQVTPDQHWSEPMAPLGEGPASHGQAGRAPDPYKLIDDAAPGGDFLDSLLGPSTPVGPKAFKKPEDQVDLLPPIGADGPLLAPRPEMPMGPAMRDHAASVSDSFRVSAPPTMSKPVIPDDWDDLLAPTPAAPQAQAIPPGADLHSHRTDPFADAFADPFGADPFAPPPVASPPAPEPVEDPFAALLAPPAPVAVPVAPPVPPPAPPVAAPIAPAADPFITDPNLQRPTPVAPPASAPTPTPAPALPSDASRAFLAALGAEEVKLSDAELPATMARLGKTLGAMITGLREILMTRTSIKSEFRIEQTMVNSGGNNPLKFSVSPEQAIEAMVKPMARGYLPADQAASQALEDIKAHEIAMVTGMEAALKGVLRKLDPASLTQKIEAKGGVGFLKNRKAQYWETYETMYAEISDQAENDFQELFATEFANAYRAQLAKLKAAKE
ncbi:type VI secretion system-associated FHA domain protein TagH [Rhodobacter sp. KR11]|uniref:type VI secretion system-associated FHA domain protein TagH n=1 Tax=Rhodobacter sp. KR11 TaxID=2974588 RepID=UPI002222419B|nr:type VI secretion system-associated FHA domain protein TagH [Rhodobacter sp. KR11]MCW1917922.1 type VI secretion system-associated FHA domain protein TagH [Rhodobacter sp. KR11]